MIDISKIDMDKARTATEWSLLFVKIAVENGKDQVLRLDAGYNNVELVEVQTNNTPAN